MWYEIIFILAMITYHQLYVQSSTITATFGYHFMIIFPSNNGNKNINPTISVTLMNPNSKEVTVQIENVKNANDFLDDSEIITVNIDAMNYAEVYFNDSSINTCKSTTFANFLECTDSRIYINSLQLPITVLSHWYLTDAGDSFLVLPLSMITGKYAFSAPPPAEDGITMVYFLPQSNNMEISVVGEVNKQPFSNSFTPKLANGNLLVLQTTGNLALTASANSAFAVIVAVTKLPITSDDNTKNDFGIYMPTPLFFTGF
ncbi:hypothetical protein QQG55_55070 [Brugia pahangi]